jgi:hypothetical protein
MSNDERSARITAEALRALVQRDLLLVDGDASCDELARQLMDADVDFEECPEEIVDWLVERPCVVDVLASNDEIREVFAQARERIGDLGERARGSGAQREDRAVEPIRADETLPHCEWDPTRTSLAITAADLMEALRCARLFWARVYELVEAGPERYDAILCILRDQSFCASAVIDTEHELDTYSANDNTTLPDGIRESPWEIGCSVPLHLWGDDEAIVLEEDPTFELLDAARSAAGRAIEDALPAYFWDPEHGGSIRRLGPVAMR